MAEELQGLLDRINREGLEKAEGEKEKILQEAREEADSIRSAAREEAEKIKHAAEAEAATLKSSGEAGLRQAARDVIIALEGQIKEVLENTAKGTLGQSMTVEQMADIVMTLGRQYAEKGGGDSVEAMIPKARQQELADGLLARLNEEFENGVSLRPAPGMTDGIKVSFDGESVVHDFSTDAISELLCAYLNPRLLEIMRADDDGGDPSDEASN